MRIGAGVFLLSPDPLPPGTIQRQPDGDNSSHEADTARPDAVLAAKISPSGSMPAMGCASPHNKKPCRGRV
jgi:hypothetical protein